VLWRARFFREGIIVCAVVAALEMAARAGGNGPNMFGFTDATGIFARSTLTVRLISTTNSSNPSAPTGDPAARAISPRMAG
jgi:hypothetical protein